MHLRKIVSLVVVFLLLCSIGVAGENETSEHSFVTTSNSTNSTGSYIEPWANYTGYLDPGIITIS